MSAPGEHDVFAVFLPSPGQSRLLKAALLDGQEGDAALSQWLGQVDNPVEALADLSLGARLLGPLICHTRRASSEIVPTHLLTYLRTAYLREALRAETYYGICSSLFHALQERGIQFAVLKGSAIATLSYPERALRHCHDIDLHLGPGALGAAQQAACELGFQEAPGIAHHSLLIHTSPATPVAHARLSVSALSRWRSGHALLGAGQCGRGRRVYYASPRSACSSAGTSRQLSALSRGTSLGL
ncbi:MAG: nucleotidyltransferase family protein [Verrucomicrobia bacterium]|nr:nucleotidyltransferase family protein [Verrucomicrobiota bacterium]